MKIAHALKGMRLLRNSKYPVFRDVPERDNNRNIFQLQNRFSQEPLGSTKSLKPFVSLLSSE